MTAEPLEPEPLDLNSLQAETVDQPAFDVPDHKKSQEPPAERVRRLFAGDRRDTPAKAPRKPKKPAPRAKHGAFVEPLQQMYAGIGIMLMPIDPVCANAVLSSAENCARTLDDLAYQNEAVRRVLTSLVTTSAAGAVFLAHMPILMAVVMHHVPSVQRAMGKMGEEMVENITRQMQAQQEGGDDNASA